MLFLTSGSRPEMLLADCMAFPLVTRPVACVSGQREFRNCL